MGDKDGWREKVREIRAGSDDDQKYGRKLLGRRYRKIHLLPESRHKENYKETWKNKIKNNKLSVLSSVTKLARCHINHCVI